MTPEIYKKMGLVHTNKDREISLLEVEHLQKTLNGHVAMWIKAFEVGEHWGHADRIWESLIEL